MKILLPYPISVNALYVNGREKWCPKTKKMKSTGRFKTKKYKDWIAMARADLQEQLLKMPLRKRSFPGMVDICVRYKRPDKRVRDGDNAVKALFDLLSPLGVLIDDKEVEHHDVGWRYDGPAGTILEIWEFGGINPYSHEKGVDYAELQNHSKYRQL